MIIVTGAAGFIGYNIAKRLNLMGIEDLILIDNKEKYPNPDNFLNLRFKIRPKIVRNYCWKVTFNVYEN